ncbi:hypothetical protein C8J57DRAFT_1255662 [Mycena rebaudengoi]|nr:hypothetical protein C8J57DRAFT_1255662 [Mycena rebaudengoi]
MCSTCQSALPGLTQTAAKTAALTLWRLGQSAWIEGSDLDSLHGGTRELFMIRKDWILYVGTYKCHDLRGLAPKGTPKPSHISTKEILDATVGIPTPPEVQPIIKYMFPDGIIKVVATGLQCVGFNQQLYDSLRRRFAEKCAAEGRPKEDAKRKEDGSGDVPPRKKTESPYKYRGLKDDDMWVGYWRWASGCRDFTFAFNVLVCACSSPRRRRHQAVFSMWISSMKSEQKRVPRDGGCRACAATQRRTSINSGTAQSDEGFMTVLADWLGPLGPHGVACDVDQPFG